MRLYIGYKYTHIPDKELLIKELLALANGLEKNGHQTFILGRDIQQWNRSFPLWKTFPAILGNMLRSDLFLAYITSEVPSNGLIIERTLARILGKKTIFAYKNGVTLNQNLRLGITFQDVNELTEKVLATI